MDKISLGIPIYNAADFIERTLLSALNQTYANIEFLLIDDKGDSMEVVRWVVENHPRAKDVRIIDQGYNQGIAAARNAILDNATGEYLFTMDCDDVITPDCIEILHSRMLEHPVDFVAASFVRADMAGVEYLRYQYKDTLIEGGRFPVAHYRYGQGKQLFVATWNKLYRLAFLKEHNIRCQVGHFNEDPWFTYQVILNASSCRLIPERTLYYTYNPQSVSGISSSKGYSDKIARQYVEIQLLKSIYIRPFVAESFYRNLLIDIMYMSLYHAFRIAESSQISDQLKKECLQSLLTVHFDAAVNQCSGKRTIKYQLLTVFFAFPMAIKLGVVNLGEKLKLKQRLKRWVHFKA